MQFLFGVLGRLYGIPQRFLFGAVVIKQVTRGLRHNPHPCWNTWPEGGRAGLFPIDLLLVNPNEMTREVQNLSFIIPMEDRLLLHVCALAAITT